MSSARISRLEISGFRSFGATPQILELTSNLCVVWGPNSHGKSSLAEAVEFLLTGQLSRRELAGSAKEEFADSIRNVHLPDWAPVYVKATVIAPDGTPHAVKRSLVEDLGRKQGCITEFRIDDQPASEGQLSLLGIVLSQPPLAAPVLTQHTLGYVFSIQKQQRATYFKAMFEVTDLDEFRNCVGAILRDIKVDGKVVELLEACAANSALEDNVRQLKDSTSPTSQRIERFLLNCVNKLISQAPSCDELSVAAGSLSAELDRRRRDTFPLSELEWRLPEDRPDAPDFAWHVLQDYEVRKQSVDEDSAAVLGLFEATLRLSATQQLQATEKIDCPLCETSNALTHERLEQIRSLLAQSTEFIQSKKEASSWIKKIRGETRSTRKNLRRAVPAFLGSSSDERWASLEEIVGTERSRELAEWKEYTPEVLKAHQKALHQLTKVERLLNDFLTNPDSDGLRACVRAAEHSYREVQSKLRAYSRCEKKVIPTLKAKVALATNTAGWEELLRLARQPDLLQAGLVEANARLNLREELRVALRAIDQAKEKVLSSKFGVLSAEIERWWTMLRPAEGTAFEELRLRPGTKRSIDFKARLSGGVMKPPAIRDVVAVFSQSQLHCLGLALFIARALREGSGFVVLDDPILSSDEDYRAHFNRTVVENLTKICQVIVLTQDQKSWTDLQSYYSHDGMQAFQICFPSPLDGSQISSASDQLAAMLSRAKPFVKSNDPELRKHCGRQLRDAAERFCKELLVKKAREAGNPAATISDYKKKELGKLIPLIQPHLTHPSHPGKLEAMRRNLNPASHNSPAPARGDLQVAFGDLQSFMKTYLT